MRNLTELEMEIMDKELLKLIEKNHTYGCEDMNCTECLLYNTYPLLCVEMSLEKLYNWK